MAKTKRERSFKGIYTSENNIVYIINDKTNKYENILKGTDCEIEEKIELAYEGLNQLEENIQRLIESMNPKIQNNFYVEKDEFYAETILKAKNTRHGDFEFTVKTVDPKFEIKEDYIKNMKELETKETVDEETFLKNINNINNSITIDNKIINNAPKRSNNFCMKHKIKPILVQLNLINKSEENSELKIPVNIYSRFKRKATENVDDYFRPKRIKKIFLKKFDNILISPINSSDKTKSVKITKKITKNQKRVKLNPKLDKDDKLETIDENNKILMDSFFD